MLGLCSLKENTNKECIESPFPLGKRGKTKFTVAVEGNIGSGKSTFLKNFMSSCNVEVLTEPVDMWKDIQGHNALELMYADPKRWSFSFQSYVQLTMLQNHSRKQVAPVKLMERSIYSAKYCFVENLYKSQLMPEIDYAIITEWFNHIVKTEKVGVDLIVYLRASPEVCLQRIKERSRHEEADVPLEYVESLHKLHEDWLICTNGKFAPAAPVLVLDANQDLQLLKNDMEHKRYEILCGYS